MFAGHENLPPQAEPRRLVLTVSQLNREVRTLLEQGLPLLWIEGELSNLARPGSGHLYFTLKDEAAQVRCAMFRPRNLLLRFRPEDGMHVLVRARVSLYEPRGEYQLIVEHMEEAGDGALRRAFEALKRKLEAEGLFDPAHKRPLPRLPRRIGIVTSPTGAAIRDMLTTLRRRFPAVEVLLFPVAVQGAGAAAEIARAVRLASERGDCDVLIVGRGGGSLEDLQAFNEESVARAIFDCRIPVVTGIGHEIDFTIADFVADVRAPTPTGAAELVVPDRADWLRTLTTLAGRLSHALQARLGRHAERTAWLAHRLERLHPGQHLRQQAQRLDDLEQRLMLFWERRRERALARLHAAEARLLQAGPQARLALLQQRLAALPARYSAAMRAQLAHSRERLVTLARALQAVSPLATLARGYAVVYGPDGSILTDARTVKTGDTITARLARGRLAARVERTEEEQDR
ncbi:MAG TPA: exodeoxyribonuclease VII large subunit [Gammaproteobacteria bacterium]|nr:exodeoxyribonuclease VII large subunit [Gammaproteobacteria bacterium]